ncbi:GNAT family N-acetyltransferase [Vacuolonema iberomarrocanum]|uniref:GNAT family N-acetyltransferase n=1 Tax=Vacuolonema iberomarrocanum TaxID=3454632 RepID=UPI0019EC3386|nr:GNAT family N-acetyltransferase [filamentous cyanobacterium LEGE 07170]
MNLTYRQIRISDLPAVFDLRLSTIENAITMEELERDYGITPKSLAEAMQSTVKDWLCEVQGSVVGIAMGDRANGEVLVVAVRPGYEGSGIGKHLLSEVSTWLFSEGHSKIWLYSNPDKSLRAYGFYRKLGWQFKGEMVDGEEVLVLENAERTSV